MEETVISVEITPEDFRNSFYYCSPWRCPLAICLRRVFPEEGKESSIGGRFIDMAGKHYRISANWGEGGENGFTPAMIDELIKQAKVSLEGIPTVTVTLTLLK